MISVTLFDPSGGAPVYGGEELLSSKQPKWVDLQATTEEELGRLAPQFGLHRLEVEDCLHLDQRPKLEEYPGHLFIVLQSFCKDSQEDLSKLPLHEMHMFLGPDWLMTVHALPNEALTQVRRRMTLEPKTASRGVDFVAYLVVDALVDANFPVFDAFSEEVDALEAAIFDTPQSEHLRRAFELRRTVTHLRRVLSPQRDVVGQLSRPGLETIQDRTSIYFRDAYDHLIRLYEQADAARDVLSNTMEAYLSMVANRTNEISKQLTIFATLFLPLTFVSGFFGQNFEQLSKPIFFYAMLALTLMIPIGLLTWFRVRRWI